jgi:hypothetical protein
MAEQFGEWTMLKACAGCGWQVEGGSTTCRTLFEEALARDFSDSRYFRVHRLMVDTYALQHPDEFCASAKSLAAHLVGLCWILEENASPAVGAEELRRWLDGNRRLVKPAVPQFRGRLTLGDLSQEADPDAWERAIKEWALETWQAYCDLQATARDWLKAAQNA